MNKEVTINGLSLSITPIEHLPMRRQLAVLMVYGDIQSAHQNNDYTSLKHHYAKVVQICLDDPLTLETLEGLDEMDLAKLADSVTVDKPALAGDVDE